MGVFTIGNGNENENQIMGINGMLIYCLVQMRDKMGIEMVNSI